MLLRSASLDDVELLACWDTKPHVIAATGDNDVIDWATEITNADPTFEIFIAEHDGRPIGVVQIIDPELEASHYWGDADPHQRAIDIWIGEEADLGRGFGTQMMTLALDRCFAPDDVVAVLIDPLATNVRAQRFYERIGFEAVGPRRFGTDDCLVMRITRDRWVGRRVSPRG